MRKQNFAAKLLKKNSLRVTTARYTVLQILNKKSTPCDVNDIVSRLIYRGIKTDPVTIYRMLDVFVKKGIVNRLNFHEGKFRYELINNDHHHLICQNCGDVQNITSCPVTELEREILINQNFLVRQHALEFFGLCSQCQ